VGSGDKLFGSVNNIDLAAAIEKEGHSIDKKYINVTGGNVKRLGKYNAIIRLHRDVAVDVPFEIIVAK
jgi:large subunit ribosomal protein L9